MLTFNIILQTKLVQKKIHKQHYVFLEGCLKVVSSVNQPR